MNKYFKFLRDVYFFKDLPDEDVEKLAESCKEEKFEKGEIIFLESSKADKFYIIMEGTVEVWKDYYDSEPDLLAVHGRGQLFGEMALVDDLPRSATLVARTPTKVLFLFRDEFQDFIQRNSRVALSILRSISSMVRKSNDFFVDGLRKRNLELAQAYEELKITQEELLRSERFSNLGKFSSMIIHDIKNPISVLKGFAEMILYHSKDPEKIKRYSSSIIKETERLNRLAGELLDYTRGEIRLNMSIVSIDQLFEKIRDAVADSLAQRDIKLIMENLVKDAVILDEERMLRVFLNLIDNSRKAMDRGGTITVSAVGEDTSLVFSISDTGLGMTKDVIEHLFEPFYSSSKMGGTGLGMVIVKNIIDAHGGKIEVKSKLRQGTTVDVKIPLHN
jgi:signal transduction histidine kinase